MYMIYVSNWQDPKKRPPTIDRFWDIDGKDKQTRLRRMNKLADAISKYQKEKKNG